MQPSKAAPKKVPAKEAVRPAAPSAAPKAQPEKPELTSFGLPKREVGQFGIVLTRK